MAVDYYQIQADLQTILVTGPAAGWTVPPKHVFIEAMDRETTFDQMPFINIRLVNADIEIIRLPNGYDADITIEMDVISYDLTHFSKAANIRDVMLQEAQLAIQETAQFSSVIQTSQLGGVTFGAGTPEGAAGHVALCTFEVIAEACFEST